MRDQDQRVAEAFAAAAELEPEEQALFLARECAGEPSVLAEVQRLLASDGQVAANRFMQEPALEVTARRMADEHIEETHVGEFFGRYEVLGLIGEGGMGEVYLAEDTELGRRVAIKLVKSGLKTREVLRRFYNERQILANLQHPNIARLLDGGTTEDGLPFFVMEYVEGRPIGKYADAHQLPTTARLKLFRTVCGAVQYAHQNLVIHRDLKPSNILVTEAGEVKLLDFGIAKLLGPAQSQQPAGVTATAVRVMTPDYASPEQVKGEVITTASDVYALGVLLYELLTGHRPYRLKSRAPHEVLQAICEQEPDKPSLAVTRTQQVAGSDGARPVTLTPELVSQTRDGHPAKLRHQLAGDLDNIVLKALRKEPERRYASVEQFSEDLRRYLGGFPVLAHQDALSYRTTKFLKRNKVGVAVAALVLLTLLGGIIATTAQRNRAEQQRLRAEKDEYANRQLLYAAQLSLAYQAWETANVGRALDLLEAQRPKPGEEDLRGFEWYLLWRLTHERSRALLGATNTVFSVAFSPDGSKVAAGSLDGKAHVWDAATGQLLRSFDAQAGVMNGYGIAFSPDGKYLAAGCANGSALIWEVETGKLARTFTHTGGVVSVAFSPDGRTLATAGDDHTVKLWRVDTGEEVATFRGHTERMALVVFSPDGKTLASASFDHTAKLWDVASGSERATLRGHSWAVLGVAFSPDGKDPGDHRQRWRDQTVGRSKPSQDRDDSRRRNYPN